MNTELLILAVKFAIILALVLFTHSIRSRYSLFFFYGLLGGLTAIMSWVTDAGAAVHFQGITFMIGSTVFYTSLLVGVFVAYVFDGPGAARISIATIAGISIISPVIAAVLQFQTSFPGAETIIAVPSPDLRINTASAVTTILDMLFLAMMWEMLGKSLKLKLWLRTLITLFGVMCFDVLVFNTGAFLGTPDYLRIMEGTFFSRIFITAFSFPILYLYLLAQNRSSSGQLAGRPVLAIITEVTAIRKELETARTEILRREEVEKENSVLIKRLQATLNRVQKLEGLLPVCSVCGKIRIDHDGEEAGEEWISVDRYIREETQVRISHGVCPECMKESYPDL